MNTKHTPGPWTIGRIGDGTEHTAPIEGAGTTVGYVEMHSFDDDETTTPEQAANARLIAAAPDLLEALRALLDASPGPDKGYVSTPYFEARQSARAAIAKATKP